MAKKEAKTNLPAIRSEHGVARRIGGAEMTFDQVHHVPAVHPTGPGPWSAEADKLAWTDPQTGFGCIILRDREGFLAGFVGVPPEHPLFGFSATALASYGDVHVHGGLNYAAPCDGAPESRSICHVVRPARSRRLPEDDDQWWFGFSADQSYDVVPRAPAPAGHELPGREPAYRDEGYMFRQCTSLAAQLHAIATGAPPPPAPADTPPTGIDPDYRRLGR